MPINFPPPPEPTQADAATLQAEASGGITTTVAGYAVHVLATGILSEQDIQDTVAGIEDLSTAVRALTAAAQRAGVVAPITHYARIDNDIYVSVAGGKLHAVVAPEELRPYFDDLVTDQPLTVGDFEPRRVLAGIHASRAQYDLTPVFAPAAGGEGYDMALKPAASGVNRGGIRVNYSNAGNRYTGREFLDLDFRYGTKHGDEFSGLERRAVHLLDIDTEVPGSEYDEKQLGWTRVTPYGLFGSSGRLIDYTQVVADNRFLGEIWVADLSWTGVPYAQMDRRISIQAKVDYTSKELNLDDFGLAQEEKYGSVELGAAYSHTFYALTTPWLAVASLSGRQGFGGERFNSDADLSYWLVRPSLSLRSQASDWIPELQIAAQYTTNTVPEQQQWVLGGILNLQSTVPGVAFGDRGVLTRLTLEHGPLVYPYVALKPKAYVEFGASQFSQSPSNGLDETATLADVGIELTAE
jgi:hypothetical protein